MTRVRWFCSLWNLPEEKIGEGYGANELGNLLPQLHLASNGPIIPSLEQRKKDDRQQARSFFVC